MSRVDSDTLLARWPRGTTPALTLVCRGLVVNWYKFGVRISPSRHDCSKKLEIEKITFRKNVQKFWYTQKNTNLKNNLGALRSGDASALEDPSFDL